MKQFLLVFFSCCAVLSAGKANAQMNVMDRIDNERRGQQRAYENYKARKANGENVNFYEGLEASVSLPLWSIMYQHSYDVYDNYITTNGNLPQNVIKNETYSKRTPAKGYIITISPSWILAKMSPKCNLAFTLNLMGGIVKYDIGKVNVPYHSYEQPISGGLIGAPLTLDLKTGGEATFDRSDALSFTCGAGLAPVGYLSGFMGAESFKGTVSPYAHMGFGFFLGGEWKIQASIIANKMDVLDLNEKDLATRFDNNTVIKAKVTSPMISVGIACFPFSFGWDKGGW